MSPARKAFLLVFLGCLALGIVVGAIKMVSPESASVTLNGEEVTGVKALITSTVIAAIPGVILGLIVAGIVKLVTRNKAAS
jgi:hypothetical protein